MDRNDRLLLPGGHQVLEARATGDLVDGLTVYDVRCRAPFRLDCSGDVGRVSVPVAPVEPAMRAMRAVVDHVQTWTHVPAADYARALAAKLGEPDELEAGLVAWNQAAGFSRVEVRDEGVAHSIPEDHTDHVRGIIALEVPAEQLDALLEATGNLAVDATTGRTLARGATLLESAIALGFAQDVLEGRAEATADTYTGRLTASDAPAWFSNPLEEGGLFSLAEDDDGAPQAEPPTGESEGGPIEAQPDDRVLIEGTASSTSVDWYGTEMTRAALEGMAKQFREGVAYVPTHWSSEWDDVIGHTVDAELMAAQVLDPAEPAEQGYVLRVIATVDLREFKGQRLVERLDRGQRIGQSIGGWFTHVQVLVDDEGAIERILVLAVELDHLAVTRTPANPDSWIQALRTKLGPAVQAARSLADLAERSRSTDPIPAPVEPAEDDTVVELSEPEPEPTGVEPSEASTVDELGEPLDTETRTGETAHDGNDAPGGAPGEDQAARTAAQPPEDAMTDDLIRSLTEAVASLTDKVEALHAAPAPTPTPTPEPEPTPAPANLADERDTELEALRGKVASLERTIGRLAAEPDRRGLSVGALNGPGSAQVHDHMVELCAEANANAMVAVARSTHGQALLADTVDDKINRAALEGGLRAICNAAVADGYLTPPDERGTWRR